MTTLNHWKFNYMKQIDYLYKYYIEFINLGQCTIQAYDNAVARLNLESSINKFFNVIVDTIVTITPTQIGE